MRGMRKYYVFVIVLSAIVLAIAAAVLIADSPRRHDRVRYKSAYRVIQDVQSYVNADTKRGIPPDVSAVYAKNAPKDVAYTRINDKIFTVCATFKQDRNATGSYDTYGYDNDGQYHSAKSYVDQQKSADPQTTYWFVGPYMYEYDGHYKAGKNCFVVQVGAGDTLYDTTPPLYEPRGTVD